MAITLLHKQQVFARLLPRLLCKAYELGFEVTVGELYRSEEEAIKNAAKGIGIVHSLHCLRLAVDLQLFKDDAYLENSDDYKELGEWWESQSEPPDIELCWGGNFKSRDGNHFSVSHNGYK